MSAQSPADAWASRGRPIVTRFRLGPMMEPEISLAMAAIRTNLSATELRMAATRVARVARRLLALALVLEGSNRTEAARLCGMGLRTLRDRKLAESVYRQSATPPWPEQVP